MDPEQRLSAAKARKDAASKALSKHHKDGEPVDISSWEESDWEEYRAASEALRAAEREYAALRNEEHAVPLEFPVQWSIGAPLPQLLVNDHRAFLIFLVKIVDPDWDGTYVTIKDPGSEQTESLALVEFKRCISAKLGDPNYDVHAGHPLAGRGLHSYTAQVVRNSRWLSEIQQINSVHEHYRPDAWKGLNHYIFWFHDSTFECIAESFTVELHDCSIPALLAEGCRRLIETTDGGTG